MILFLVVLFLMLVVTVVVLGSMLSRTKGQLFEALRMAARGQARHKTAARRAKGAEEKCGRLFHDTEVAVATVRQAVDNGEQIAVMSGLLHRLWRYATEATGDHALPMRCPSRRACPIRPARWASRPWPPAIGRGSTTTNRT